MDLLVTFLGLFGGVALGQFSFATGWIALGLAGVCGYLKRSWFSIQLLGFAGGLVAHWWFKGTAVDQRLNGLASHLLFNILVYMAIACVGYALGWVLMRVLRKSPED